MSGQKICCIQDILRTVNAAVFSPDEAQVVCRMEDATVLVFDAASGQNVIVLQVHARVMSVAFSPDSKTVVSGCYDKKIRW